MYSESTCQEEGNVIISWTIAAIMLPICADSHQFYREAANYSKKHRTGHHDDPV
jgi:hypothetical protein